MLVDDVLLQMEVTEGIVSHVRRIFKALLSDSSNKNLTPVQVSELLFSFSCPLRIFISSLMIYFPKLIVMEVDILIRMN
jgi:hypothetical protein